MSEYQYYEFKAIDKPLSETDMKALRNISTRAHITPTSFVNVYNWGDLKGDPLKMVARYFDAFLYVANWRTHWFMLKVPRHLVDVDLVNQYCCYESAAIHESGDHIIFEFISETGEYEWEEGEEWLSSLISLRADILRSDYRSLYLAWLFCAQMGEIAEEEPEPPVPPNLKSLNASLKEFVEFMRIDTDLISVAAENSIGAGEQVDTKSLKTWIQNLPESEKNDFLFRLVEAPRPHIGAELIRRFQQTVPTETIFKSEKYPRTVDDLISKAETIAEERKRRAAKQKAREQARKQREKALAREKYIKSLVGQEDKIWEKVNDLIDTKQPKNYDHAVKLLIDLKDLNKMHGKEKAFNKRLKAICEDHYRKVTFLNRLEKVGLLGRKLSSRN